MRRENLAWAIRCALVSAAATTMVAQNVAHAQEGVQDLEEDVAEQGLYTNQLHDIYGRVPYVRYEQDL